MHTPPHFYAPSTTLCLACKAKAKQPTDKHFTLCSNNRAQQIALAMIVFAWRPK